jgi:hypothetical protein
MNGLAGQASEHEADYREAHEGCDGASVALEVARQAVVCECDVVNAIYPCEVTSRGARPMAGVKSSTFRSMF